MIQTILSLLLLGGGTALAFSEETICWSAHETILYGDGIPLGSTRDGDLNTLVCEVDQQISLNVRTIYIDTCSSGSIEFDGIVQQWYNWYPQVVNVSSGGGSTATATCVSAGSASIGVKVEEPHAYCMQGNQCQPVSSGFPVVTAPVEVQ
jgi:hypothetical protein